MRVSRLRSAQASACALVATRGLKPPLYLLVAMVAVWVATLSIASAAETTLLDAAERGDRAAALHVLAKGADPNAPGPDGTTAIMWAASNNDLELVRALIKAGANVKVKNQFGTSAITEAAIIGSAPIIDALLKAGADPNTTNPEVKRR
jgi:ankyrin repeat protein